MTRLNTDLILDEAMLIVEQEGEAALAMRPLAARLGVTPMALYRYIADRDALLVALVARVSERIVLPEPRGTPGERAAALALYLHDFLVEHPWMIRLISTGRLASPAGLRFPEGFLGCAYDAGLNEGDAFLFYRTIFAAILGQAQMTHAKQGRAATLPDHEGVDIPLTVAALAPRWAQLDDNATPARVLRAVASLLDTP